MTLRQPSPQHCPPTSGKPVNVTVFAKKAASADAIDWRIDWNLDNGPSKGDTDIEVPPRKSQDPETPIFFHLKDTTGRGLRFDPEDPIWVGRGECPKAFSKDEEIPVREFVVQPKLLKIVDLNAEKCVLHYNLRFRDRAGRKECYDPRIRNGGTSG